MRNAVTKLRFTINKLHVFFYYTFGSSCSEEKSPMVRLPDPEQYWNNWKNDMSLFPV